MLDRSERSFDGDELQAKFSRGSNSKTPPLAFQSLTKKQPTNAVFMHLVCAHHSVRTGWTPAPQTIRTPEEAVSCARLGWHLAIVLPSCTKILEHFYAETAVTANSQQVS